MSNWKHLPGMTHKFTQLLHAKSQGAFPWIFKSGMPKLPPFISLKEKNIIETSGKQQFSSCFEKWVKNGAVIPRK